MKPSRLIAIALASAIPAVAAPTPDYGPAPSVEDAHATVEVALKAKMIDPTSTRIRWPYAFTAGFTNYLFGQPNYGWWTCGRIDSKGRDGNYVGEVWFTVLMKDGQILSLDRGNTLEVTHASAHCEDAVRTGQLKPRPELVYAANAPAPPAPPANGLGIGFLPTAQGAVIKLVMAGSPAERAGLKVGQVIEAVNGTPIKGLATPEMIKAVRAETPAVFLSLAGGRDIKVTRRPS
jgi:hypothetical protein